MIYFIWINTLSRRHYTLQFCLLFLFVWEMSCTFKQWSYSKVPRPDPCGSEDQLWISSPPPQRCNNCSFRETGDDTQTSSLHTHTAFSSAPTTQTHNFRYLYIYDHYQNIKNKNVLCTVLMCQTIWSHSMCLHMSSHPERAVGKSPPGQ